MNFFLQPVDSRLQPLARRLSVGLVFWLVCSGLPLFAQAPADDFPEVAKILVRSCLGCHQGEEARGNLDLSSSAGLLGGGDAGPAIVPGQPANSLLLERVTEGSMPPKGKGAPLDEKAIARLRTWIQAGAPWPAERVLSPFDFTTDQRAGNDWWSLQPVVRPTPPADGPAAAASHPIDAFVLAQLATRGLFPSPAADRLTLLRRAKFDLLGLPPTPAEIDAFLADEADGAWERLLDRLLASPHYGERWGRHWLDVVRFGESDGFENDKLRPHAWRYRDYVIQSLNDDKPYAQFVREQLAGDVLSPPSHDGIVATGFLVAGPWDEVQNVGRSEAERMRTHEEQLEELIAAVSQTFLGLTVNCARCHDHKFDPILQTDYYRLKAVFDGVDHGNLALFLPEEQRAYDVATAPVQEKLKTLKAELASLAPATAGGTDRVETALVDGRFGQALDARRVKAGTASRPEYDRPPLTIECWSQLQSASAFNILVANRAKESAAHWEMYSYAGAGDLSVYLPAFEPAEIRSGRTITDGKWHHTAFTFNGERVRLYLDAELVKEVAVTRKRTGEAAGELHFGCYPPHNIGCDGLVDEVRISNVERDLSRLPEAPLAVDEQTLGLWHFDRADGDRLRNAAARETPAATSTTVIPTDETKRPRETVMAEIKQAEAELATHPVPMTYSGTRRQPKPTVLFRRGDITLPGPEVLPGALSALSKSAGNARLTAESPEAERRRQFAEWVVSPRNPLTARVLVNRVWQYHFGRGLVELSSDFGFHGGRPSHPELLDWLADEFVNPAHKLGDDPPRAWSLKRLHKLIMSTATYRQSALRNARADELDADNRWLWRYAPRRLEAEIVRDAMLAVSGDLNPQVGGPSFRPFTVTSILTQFYHLIDPGTPEFNRRTVYRISVNTAKSPFLDAFDCPAPSVSMPQRRQTTTPLQALALMNDSFVLRQAEHFAARVKQAAGPEPAAQIPLAYRMAFGRLPSTDELQAAQQLTQEHGLDNLCWVLLNASEFLYIR